MSFPDRGRNRSPRLDHPDGQHGGQGRRRDPFRLREEIHPGRSGELESPGRTRRYPGVREKGLLRLEGKEYIVKDGDVLVIRHG